MVDLQNKEENSVKSILHCKLLHCIYHTSYHEQSLIKLTTLVPTNVTGSAILRGHRALRPDGVRRAALGRRERSHAAALAIRARQGGAVAIRYYINLSPRLS